jgi:hypothetical protein
MLLAAGSWVGIKIKIPDVFAGKGGKPMKKVVVLVLALAIAILGSVAAFAASKPDAVCLASQGPIIIAGFHGPGGEEG